MPRKTEAVLNLLVEHNVPATFFPVGAAIEEHSKKAQLSAGTGTGHKIGNHSYADSKILFTAQAA
jgi:peptidoglycan/xylan/chitin deacetylase (PgdA/CDA1 family)